MGCMVGCLFVYEFGCRLLVFCVRVFVGLLEYFFVPIFFRFVYSLRFLTRVLHYSVHSLFSFAFVWLFVYLSVFVVRVFALFLVRWIVCGRVCVFVFFVCSFVSVSTFGLLSFRWFD